MVHPSLDGGSRFRNVLADAPDRGSYQPASGPGTTKQPENPPGDQQALLARIDAGPLPDGYSGTTHQQYVDRRLAGFTPAQRARLGQLWRNKQRLDPDMPNRGASFVKILEYLAGNAER